MNRLFKTYVAIMLLLIVLLLGALDAGLAYGGHRAETQANNVTEKVDSLNTSLNNLNDQLTNIDAQLKTNNIDLNAVLKP